MSSRVISSLNDVDYYKQSSKEWVISLPDISEGITIEFFDGVAKESACGAGMILNVKKDSHIHLRIVVGKGRNIKE